MAGMLRQLFSWGSRPGTQYERVAESEMAAHVHSRAGASCALVSGRAVCGVGTSYAVCWLHRLLLPGPHA
jgi:hypothetical protein